MATGSSAITIDILGNASSAISEMRRTCDELGRFLGSAGAGASSLNNLSTAAKGASRHTSSLGISSGGLNKEVGNVSSSIEGMVGKLAGLAAGYLSVRAAVGFAMSSLDEASKMESIKAELKVMLGNDEGAMQAMMKEITTFAASTPFEMPQLAEAAKTMLSFGISASDIMANIKMLGDVSGANSEKFSRLTLAFSQIQASGKLMGQDLIQLINAGFNPLKMMSEQTGVSMEEMQKKMSAGGISAADVAAQFKIATSEGGLFFGNMDKQSETWKGRMSTLADNWKQFQSALATPIMDALKPLLTSAGESMAGLAEMGKRVGTAIANTISILAGAFQAGELGGIISAGMGIAFKEAINILYAGIQGVGALVGELIVGMFGLVASGEFWVGMLTAFAGIGEILVGAAVMFGMSMMMKMNAALRPLHEGLLGTVIMVGDYLRVAFVSVALLLKEKLLDVMAWVLDKVKYVGMVLGMKKEMEEGAKTARAGAEATRKERANLGESMTFDESKKLATVGLDARDELNQKALDAAKATLKDGMGNFSTGFNVVAPLMKGVASKAAGAFTNAVGGADTVFDTTAEKQALADKTAKFLPKPKAEEKPVVKVAEKAKEAIAAKAEEQKKAVAKADQLIVDSNQSVGAGGNIGFSKIMNAGNAGNAGKTPYMLAANGATGNINGFSPATKDPQAVIISELQKQTTLLEKLIAITKNTAGAPGLTVRKV